MLDLETLSTAGDAAIVQIGLSPFWIDQVGPCGPGLQLDVDPQSCIDEGFRVDWGAIHFWLTQTQEARDAMPKPGTGLSIREALLATTAYIQGLKAQTDNGRLYVWSNGATFDIPIMSHAYRKLRLPEPWGYQDPRDTRTLAMLGLNAIKPKPIIAHRALDDAESQVHWVQNMWREARGGMVSTGPAPGGMGDVIAS